MAELIDKCVLIDNMKAQWDMQDLYMPVHFEYVVDEIPTTTEAEIRAKAISEFAEKFIYTAVCEGCSGCTNCYETGSQYRCDRYSYLKQIAEQLKGEHGRKLNRCDTCIHFVNEETVPPICYFCCKGMEDNYKVREGEA